MASNNPYEILGVSPSASDDEVKAVLEDAKAQLGTTGRLVVRPSGTEPLIRIMTEGEDDQLVSALATQTAEKIRHILSKY